jgi:hypothetical protein
MKKAIVFLAIGMSLVLLLGLAKSDPKPQKPQWIESGCCQGYAPGFYWQKVKDYEIVRASGLGELEGKIKDKLEHGWHLKGDISRFEDEYCQVMVK